ncbi:LamG domain-containing protein, partial [Brumimicrobium mesophilum]|uniref:LamG domain-containing protein n=1 Tax=Brumimicrobium mesophilum TaxID=392717 RepID=UPI0018FECC98
MKKQLFSLLAIFIFIGGTYSQVALNFNGNGDYLATDFPGIIGNNPITIEAWVKTDGVNNEQVITSWGSEISNGGRFTFRLNNVGGNFVPRIEIKGGGINGATDLNDGNWHHVAVTYDPALTSNKYKLIVDGVLDTEGDISQSLNVIQDVNMNIGRRINLGFTGYFNGSMDDVKVWNVAKSEATILANMNAEICTQSVDLVAYYNFNEGTPLADNSTITEALDFSDNLGSAALINFTLNGSTSNYVTGPTLTEGITSSVLVENACNDYTWAENSTLYNTSGIYSEVVTATSGCDSILILDLTIVQPEITTITEISCNSFTWTENGMTYTTSGQYSETFTNQAGCDSTITLDLTINQAD